MINSIIKRAKERFNQLAPFDRTYDNDFLVEYGKTLFREEEYPENRFELDEDKVKDFLETEIRAAVREVLEEVKDSYLDYDMTEDFDHSDPMMLKINQILNNHEN